MKINVLFAVATMFIEVPALRAQPLPTSQIAACPEDGRLKGVPIASKRYKDTVYRLPGHACVVTGPNGMFLVTVDGVRKLSNTEQ
jgi:hypothetical protein